MILKNDDYCIEIAKNLLKAKVDLETIKLSTGLSDADIESLRSWEDAKKTYKFWLGYKKNPKEWKLNK